MLREGRIRTMYCSKCGQELQDGQKFCANCGAPADSGAASSGATPPPPPPGGSYPPPGGSYPPPGGSYPPPGGGNPNAKTLDLVLKIFSGICAALFAFQALGLLLGTLRLFSYFWLGSIPFVLLSLLGAVAAIWMALVLVVLILKRTPPANDALMACLCAGVAARLVLNLLATLVNLLGGYFHFSFSFLWYALPAAVVFLLLYLMGEPPFLGKTGDSLKASVLEGLALLLSNDAPVGGPQQTPPPSGGYYQPGPSGAQDGGQARQNYSYGYQGAPQPGGGAYSYQTGPLKTDRSLVAYILLNIVTCGIYGYYFLYTLARDVNTVCEGDGERTPGLLPFILLSIVTCGFYALYWYYCVANRLAANGPRYGLNIQENGTTILLWYLLGLLLCGIGPYVAMFFLIKNTNRICDAYNRR